MLLKKIKQHQNLDLGTIRQKQKFKQKQQHNILEVWLKKLIILENLLL